VAEFFPDQTLVNCKYLSHLNDGLLRQTARGKLRIGQSHFILAQRRGICDVIATTTKSGRVSFKRSGEMINPGRCLMALRSVNGNGTRTTSPCLKVVVDGIFGIVPEFERRLRRFEPRNIVRLDFQDAPASLEANGFAHEHPNVQSLR